MVCLSERNASRHSGINCMAALLASSDEGRFFVGIIKFPSNVNTTTATKNVLLYYSNLLSWTWMFCMNHYCLIRDILILYPDYPRRAEICWKLVERASYAKETDAIKDSIRNTFQVVCLWLVSYFLHGASCTCIINLLDF